MESDNGPEPLVSMSSTRTLQQHLHRWRNLPAYQLERRADIFFTPYLKEVLAMHLDLEMSDIVIPEFPVHQRLTRSTAPKGAYSDKVDFTVPSRDRRTVAFVELKTDMGSFREKQNATMTKAADLSFHNVLEGVKALAERTKAYAKYASLLSLLESADFIEVPPQLWTLDYEGSPRGYKRLVRQVTILLTNTTIVPVYIQPRVGPGETRNAIDFRAFSDVVAAGNDELSEAFAECLRLWTEDPGLFR